MPCLVSKIDVGRSRIGGVLKKKMEVMNVCLNLPCHAFQVDVFTVYFHTNNRRLDFEMLSVFSMTFGEVISCFMRSLMGSMAAPPFFGHPISKFRHMIGISS